MTLFPRRIPMLGIVFPFARIRPVGPDIEISGFVGAPLAGDGALARCLATLAGVHGGDGRASPCRASSAIGSGQRRLSKSTARKCPVMDGSARAFRRRDRSDRPGCGEGAAALPQECFRPVRVEMGSAHAVSSGPLDGLPPRDRRSTMTAPSSGGRPSAINLTPQAFRSEIARARTFGFLADVEKLWSRGFALGASLDNAVVIGDDRVINPEGLRYTNEFVRHKALDAVGDIALASAPIMGCYRSHRGGHRLNVMAVEALLARNRLELCRNAGPPKPATPTSAQVSASQPGAPTFRRAAASATHHLSSRAREARPGDRRSRRWSSSTLRFGRDDSCMAAATKMRHCLVNSKWRGRAVWANKLTSRWSRRPLSAAGRGTGWIVERHVASRPPAAAPALLLPRRLLRASLGLSACKTSTVGTKAATPTTRPSSIRRPPLQSGSGAT